MTLKVGLIGCGRMGCFTSDKFKQNCAPGWLPLSHAEGIQAVDGMSLVALCDTQPTSLARAAELYPNAASYSDFKEMIRKEQPDIVTIATRTPERAEIVRYAAENGVQGIHIEKPLAQSLGDCLDVIESLAKHDVKISYGTYRRYHGLYRQAMDIVADGKLGTLRELTLEMGREMLLWCHPHSIDMMLMFSGNRTPEMVWADCLYDPANLQGAILDEDPIVRHGYVRFSDEFCASIVQTSGRNLRISGDQAVLTVFNNGRSMTLKAHSEHEVKESPVFDGASGTVTALTELRDGIVKGGNMSFGFAELEMNTRLLLSLAYSSSKGGVPVMPDQLPLDFRVTGRMGKLYA